MWIKNLIYNAFYKGKTLHSFIQIRIYESTCAHSALNKSLFHKVPEKRLASRIVPFLEKPPSRLDNAYSRKKKSGKQSFCARLHHERVQGKQRKPMTFVLSAEVKRSDRVKGDSTRRSHDWHFHLRTSFILSFEVCSLNRPQASQIRKLYRNIKIDYGHATHLI